MLAAVLPVRLHAFGGFDLDQVVLNRPFDRQTCFWHRLFIRVRLDLSGKDSQLHAPGLKSLPWDRAYRLLPAFSAFAEVEVEHPAFGTDRPSINENQARIGLAFGIASDGDELPFSVQLAILFKVYLMTLGLHSVLSLSPVASASTNASKGSSAGHSDGMDTSIYC